MHLEVNTLMTLKCAVGTCIFWKVAVQLEVCFCIWDCSWKCVWCACGGVFEGVGGAACLKLCVPLSEHAMSTHVSVWGFVLDFVYFTVCLCAPLRMSGVRRWLGVTDECVHREQVCPVVCVCRWMGRV